MRIQRKNPGLKTSYNNSWSKYPLPTKLEEILSCFGTQCEDVSEKKRKDTSKFTKQGPWKVETTATGQPQNTNTHTHTRNRPQKLWLNTKYVLKWMVVLIHLGTILKYSNHYYLVSMMAALDSYSTWASFSDLHQRIQAKMVQNSGFPLCMFLLLPRKPWLFATFSSLATPPGQVFHQGTVGRRRDLSAAGVVAITGLWRGVPRKTAELRLDLGRFSLSPTGDSLLIYSHPFLLDIKHLHVTPCTQGSHQGQPMISIAFTSSN